MELSNFISKLDFDEFDYFYHETERGNGERIMEEGLLVNGTNILDTDNILFTTALPLTKDLVSDKKNFENFLNTEKSDSSFRKVSEMVILGAPKYFNEQLVVKYDDYHDGEYYEGIVNPNFILGYIDLSDKKFHVNENYEYSNELLFDDDFHR